ncbi:hypothetical protein FNV43_RR08500 [Rhamnella rubrinervis]|uniref:Leucine-rich repeat-containing N-terminal plant-type domain-containing protein n=1 Tax=Rhamnella rubrinervis TaxID=2594499 RepID=A0A8K0H8B6_9ROSA|nr:hypothetical protein FNV43_RR08500 [Rhamnella rubrinervis]
MTSSPIILCLLFEFFYSTLFNHVVVSSGGQCLSDQQSLLLQFKNTLIFNPTESKSLVRWNQSSDCCAWEGISCEQGRVTGLKLSNESISGGINDNSTLFNLQYLQSLDLSYNFISSTIPSSIVFGNFSNLTSLQLFECDLYGTFPKEMFQVPTLRILDISRNGLLEGSLPEFPPHSDLQIVNIRHTNFKGTLPSSVGNLQQLTHLDLSYCLISGPLPKSIAKFTQLVHLDLSNNQFSDPISSAHLEGLLNLLYIDLHNNSFNGYIPSSLFTLPLLEEIDLSYNQFSGQGPTSLGHLALSYNNISINVSGNGSNIPFLPKLNILLLRSCNLGKFPEIIKNQAELTDLDLSNNQIYGEIPNWIWKIRNCSLQYLNLSHNQLVGIQEPYSLYNIYNLYSLDLSFNQIHGKIPILPPQLYYIDLSSNSFTSSIPSDIGKSLENTLCFSLSMNGLTGSIPESICDATELQVLDLSDNNLYGKIPTPAMSRSIIGVNLRMKNLSGPIPDLFRVDCSLKTLDLNGNLLTKSIPKSLANCTALEDLDLGNNQMLDTFPLSLKNISGLRVLSLRSNKFYGQITCTESVGDWPMIQIVDIASNNFSGELPGKCLTKWHTMMTVTGYRQSQLDHTILDSSRSPLSNSRFLWNISYEDAVSITHKGLEMQMRKIASNGFTYIDFSSNKFHGEIPKELGQLISLHGLNLSNNVLSGQIPSSFGNMRQLESLDLSRNHLSGKIPASLSSLIFLGFLNLSHNQLHGRIPGSQIQLFPADRFQGNQGLYGLLVTLNCPGDAAAPDISQETPKANHSISGNNEIEWNLISAEIGFIVGFGTVIGPLVFWKRWRKWYFDRVEDIAFSILPQILLRKWLSWKMGTRRGVRAGGRRES